MNTTSEAAAQPAQRASSAAPEERAGKVAGGAPPTARAPASTRAGRYVAQPGSYRAFVPAPLPPVPPVERDDEYWMLLSDADRALGELNGSIRTLPHPELFVSMYVRKEASLSSQIEGTQASLLDVLEFEARALETGAAPDVDEIVTLRTS